MTALPESVSAVVNTPHCKFIAPIVVLMQDKCRINLCRSIVLCTAPSGHSSCRSYLRGARGPVAQQPGVARPYGTGLGLGEVGWTGPALFMGVL